MPGRHAPKHRRDIPLHPERDDSDTIHALIPDKLYAGNRPGRWRYLHGVTPDEYVLQWAHDVRTLGITDVIVMLTMEEIARFYRGGLMRRYRQAGLRVTHIPVPPNGTPYDPTLFLSLFKPAAERIRSGSKKKKTVTLIQSGSGMRRVNLGLYALKRLNAPIGELPPPDSAARRDFLDHLPADSPINTPSNRDEALYRASQTFRDYVTFHASDVVRSACRLPPPETVRATMVYNMGTIFRDAKRLLTVDFHLPTAWVSDPSPYIDALRGVNAAVFTHYHVDHMSELCVKILLEAGCPVFALPAEPVAGKTFLLDWGVPEQHIVLIRDGESFSAGGFRFHPHGGAHLNPQIPQMPMIEWVQNGIRFFHTGDHRDFMMPLPVLRGRPDLIIAAVPQRPNVTRAENAAEWFGALNARRLWLTHIYEVSRIPKKMLTLHHAAHMIERMWIRNSSMQAVAVPHGYSQIIGKA